MSDAWIDRLFQRFATMYGKEWLDKWAGIPMEEVKRTWAADLRFASGEQIAKALAHCAEHNKFAPSSPEFVALCRAFSPRYQAVYELPEPKRGDIDPAIRTAIAQAIDASRKPDPKDWACKILKAEAEGIRQPMIAAQFAREALGIKN